jgi:diguanylate cyclase (GGDEF)-like protein
MNSRLSNSVARPSGIDDLVKLSFFAEIGTAIASARTLKETLGAVMNHIGQVFAPEHWSLLLRNRSTGELTFEVVTGSACDALKGRTIPKGRGIAGWIAENASPVIVSDVSKDPRFDGSFDAASGFKTQSIIGVPLITRGEVFGVIELVNKIDGSSFSALELKMLTTIADFAAIAIERAYYIKVLRRVAAVDPLTNVFNRRVIARQLEREKGRVKRHKTRFSVIMVDLDDFKATNDTYGHAAGDRILQAVAAIITRSVRKVDVVARYGGDEFLILLPVSNQAAAERVRNRILAEIDEYNRGNTPTVSLTVGLYEADEDSVDDIIERVDAEMYLQKGRRRESDEGMADMPRHLKELLDEE